MSEDSSGCALGVGAIIIRLVAWIGIGIATFDWIEVEDFWSAILWLFVWHIATTVVHFILIGLVMLFTDR